MKTVSVVAAVALFVVAVAYGAESGANLPELKPVPGKPLSMWFNYRTGDFSGASQIWGELRNDSKAAIQSVRIVFVSLDANGKEIATSSDSVRKLAAGEVWSFEIHPKETGVRRFDVKTIEFAANERTP